MNTPADSKFLARLDAAIGSADNPVRAACLRAERAGYWARQGYFEEARGELIALRAEFGKRPQPEVSVWLCLLEGWIAYYRSFDMVALDWIKRAHALSVAMSLGSLRAMAAAWLAHLHDMFGTCQQAVQYVQEALDLSQPDEHATRARASLVVASLGHFAGRFDLAKPWYVKARMHARTADDAQSLSALSFNMASQQLRAAHVAAVFSTTSDTELRQVATSTQATESFDIWSGNEALRSMLPTMHAIIASLRGDHQEAIELFGADFSGVEADGLNRIVPILFAERAWCHLRLDDRVSALADAESAEIGMQVRMDDDDRALALGRLAQVHSGLGDVSRAEACRARAHEALGRHRALQAEALNLLAARGLVEMATIEEASSC